MNGSECTYCKLSCDPVENLLLRLLLSEKEERFSFRTLLSAIGSNEKEIWDSLCSLESKGFLMSYSPLRGFAITEPLPDFFHPAEVQFILERMNGYINWRAEIFEVIDSTSDEVLRRGKRGEKEGLVVISDKQLQGRGRQGRSWESSSSLGLYMTLLLEPRFQPIIPQQFAIMSSLSVVEALKGMGLENVGIKWPNDIMVDSRKLGGILIETDYGAAGKRFVAIGIGINVNHKKHQFSKPLQKKATSIYMETGQTQRRIEVMAEVLRRIDHNYRLSFSEVKEKWIMQMVNLDQKIEIEERGQKIKGRIRGVAEMGWLIVEKEDGSIQKVFSAGTF
ncbi:biotin--[acetyl-CoA-carboxylase] ligase [Methylacidiphilum caldifontis]|uniref:biotin--[biotin carboxyl-carrier protein] ligase n=1 Tax=Methylacidiphilum caldifontis TaxID=2795386 RepID=A0A4Y8PJJ5_9BACT|nr:biotin--[acetyl-CoA-carboxylase] ligase [Methylacidiphilum caldifontis]QSR88530.1 biotin--[acetyl-CoA-carboxylase] ligase [Methylacidiphilum caldifontis]TFE72078.1 biotin--[acetyl-CoA-carboxylase] ligase [Methylacidiphilum caldifontis]